MLSRIYAIARNAFREAVRDRVLYNLILFVLLLIGGAIFLGELSAGQDAKIIVDLGLSAMLLFGVFIAIFVGVGLVYKEIERRTVYSIFAKPVGRGEFLIGKYLGLCLTLLVNVLIMGAGVSLALIYVSRGWDPLVLRIWPAVLLIYLELMILSTSMQNAGARWLFAALYYLLPNLANYSFITQAAHGHFPRTSDVMAAILFAFLFVVVILAAATLIFSRRNFK